MNINLRIIQEYYSKIQLKYNETIVSLKQKDESDNHYIMFKNQFSEFNNLMLVFFNIVPSSYNENEFKDKLVTTITLTEELLADVNPVDGKCCCYVANTGNVVIIERIIISDTGEAKTTTINILSGADISNNLLITSTYNQLTDNTLLIGITIQPFIYSVINFGLINGVNNKNDTIKDFYEEIIEGTNPVEPENPKPNDPSEIIPL